MLKQVANYQTQLQFSGAVSSPGHDWEFPCHKRRLPIHGVDAEVTLEVPAHWQYFHCAFLFMPTELLHFSEPNFVL